MADRCPQCLAALPEDRVFVCPNCRYTLRTPGSAKMGIVFMVFGLLLLCTYVIGPETLGLRSGAIPADLAEPMLANYPVLVGGTFAVGALLAASGALMIRREQARLMSS